MESKQLPAVVVVPAELQELHRQIEEWRSTRPHRQPHAGTALGPGGAPRQAAWTRPRRTVCCVWTTTR